LITFTLPQNQPDMIRFYTVLFGTIIALTSCRSSYPAYISNRTGQNITVSYKPYSFVNDTSDVKKEDMVSKRPDTVFHLSPRPTVCKMNMAGKPDVITRVPFSEVVVVELKPGEFLGIGDLSTSLDWEEVFRVSELSVIKNNESSTIKDPRKDFIRKKGTGVIYEIK
jgi:hypothetical protein